MALLEQGCPWPVPAWTGVCAGATGDKDWRPDAEEANGPGESGEKVPETGALSMGSLGVRRQVDAFLAPSDTSRPYSHSGLPPPHGLLASQVLLPPLPT